MDGFNRKKDVWKRPPWHRSKIRHPSGGSLNLNRSIDLDSYLANEILKDDDAFILEGHEEAMLGIGHRCGQPTIAVYDRRLLIGSFMKVNKWSFETAQEWVEYNIEGAWIGEKTPLILDKIE